MVTLRTLMMLVCVGALCACSATKEAAEAVTGAASDDDGYAAYKACAKEQENPEKVWEMCGELYKGQ